MKKYTFFVLFFLAIKVLSQNTTILPDRIVIPKLTTTQRNNLTSLQAGQMIYNTDENCINLYKNGVWQSLCSITSTGTGKTINVSTQTPATDPLARDGANTIFITGNTNASISIKEIDGGVEGTTLTIALDHSLLCPNSGSLMNYTNAVPLTVIFSHNQATNASNSIITPQSTTITLQSGSCGYMEVSPLPPYIPFPNFESYNSGNI